MAERCPTCGGAVKVVGKTTLHYESVTKLDVADLEERVNRGETVMLDAVERMNKADTIANDRLREIERLQKELDECVRSHQKMNANFEQALDLLLEPDQQAKSVPPDLWLRIQSFVESE